MTDKETTMDQLVCGDCMFCMPGPDTQSDILSRACYRMPPVPMLAQTSQGVGLVSVRPLIRVDTWACGEFDDKAEDDVQLPGLTS